MADKIATYGEESIVYLDESGFTQEVYVSEGWVKKGAVLPGIRSGKRTKKTNLLLAQQPTRDKDRPPKRFAAWLFEGTCNALLFNQWLTSILLPTLKRNQTLVMDNAAFHKGKKTQELIQNAGCHLLFLPPYSPHLNPIEQTFGSLKKQRMYAKTDISIDELVSAIL